MTEITLRGRKIPLLYTVYEMKAVQEEVCPLGELQYVLFGRNRDDEKDTSRYGAPEHIGTVAKMVRILGNAGLEEAGEKPDLTDKMIRRMMRPDQIGEMVNAVLDAMAEGMQSEIPKEVKTGPVDVTLEEIEKKKETES